MQRWAWDNRKPFTPGDQTPPGLGKEQLRLHLLLAYPAEPDCPAQILWSPEGRAGELEWSGEWVYMSFTFQKPVRDTVSGGQNQSALQLPEAAL